MKTLREIPVPRTPLLSIRGGDLPTVQPIRVGFHKAQLFR